jgi:hypothetical protein
MSEYYLEYFAGCPVSVLKKLVRRGMPSLLRLENLASLLVWANYSELWKTGGPLQAIEELTTRYRFELFDDCERGLIKTKRYLTNGPITFRLNESGSLYPVEQNLDESSYTDIVHFLTLEDYCAYDPQCRLCQWLNEDVSASTPVEESLSIEHLNAERVPRSKWPELLTKTDIKKSFDKLTPSQWDYRLDGVLKGAKRRKKDVKAAYFVTRQVTNYLIEENLYSEKQIDQILLNNKLSSPPEGNTRQPETGTKAKPEAKTD